MSERDLEPLGLIQHEGRWFLASYCVLRIGLRLFWVDRVEAASILCENFERPEDFEVSAFLYNSIALAPATWRVEVWLGVPPEALKPRLPRAKAGSERHPAVLWRDGPGGVYAAAPYRLLTQGQKTLRA